MIRLRKRISRTVLDWRTDHEKVGALFHAQHYVRWDWIILLYSHFSIDATKTLPATLEAYRLMIIYPAILERRRPAIPSL